LTTNGSALAAKATRLKDAGLSRVTISLDALDDHTFAAMNDVGFPVARVLGRERHRRGRRAHSGERQHGRQRGVNNTALARSPSTSAAPGTSCG
jgi:MoaA/NifB/PqqE/SkfB family radical SAM enzyme